MNEKNEQRVCIKFCVKLGKSATETFEMLRQAFHDHALGRTQVFEWHARFKSGRESVEDDERSGRPVTSRTPENVNKISELIHEDRRQTINELSALVGIGYGVCQEILTEDLNMRRIAAKFVPNLLTGDQRQRRVDVCQELRELASNDRCFLSRIITGDESWCYGYDPETKQQSSQWTSPQSPRPKKARQVRSATKTMLIIFFDIRGIVHHEFVPPKRTVNSELYCDVLRRLKKAVRRKRPDLWDNRSWLLHHDNAPAHTSFRTTEFLTNSNIALVPHPPYSPDLAPCDFSFFPQMKMKMRGHRYETVEHVQSETRAVLKTFDEGFFRNSFETWKNRWDRCISAGGDYFEGDGRSLSMNL